MEQEIRFCTTPDGVRIAYAIVGQGPPLVKTPDYFGHLEFEWQSPVWRHWFRELARDHLLVRYDERGNGLSDWEVEDLSFETWVCDLETVVEALNLDRFALLAISRGASVAIEYTVRHPERVTYLILYVAIARGWRKRRMSPEEFERRRALLTLTEHGWGQDNPSFRQLFTTLFIPDASPEQMRWFNDLQRMSTSPKIAARYQIEAGKIDVMDRLPRVTVPTLVLHCRGDSVVPFEEGRLLAASIPGARFVPLPSRNHLLLEEEPAWATFLEEVRRFVGVKKAMDRVAPAEVPGVETTDAASLVAELGEVALSRFRVVGSYIRYDEGVRQALRDARQKIAMGCGRPSRQRENHLIWGPPGCGKTYFVQQVAASLPRSIQYQELNLAKYSQQELIAGLRELEGDNEPHLCLIDEIDAKPDEPWPYPMLLSYLDARANRGAPLVFVLAGSFGASMGEMKEKIAARPKGSDLLSRIPSGNEYEMPPLNLGDRSLVALSQFRQAGREAGREVRAVEKMGLWYIVKSPRLADARQLRELAVRAVEQMAVGDDRIKYDNLFSPGDPENKSFWIQAQGMAPILVNRFVILED